MTNQSNEDKWREEFEKELAVIDCINTYAGINRKSMRDIAEEFYLAARKKQFEDDEYLKIKMREDWQTLAAEKFALKKQLEDLTKEHKSDIHSMENQFNKINGELLSEYEYKNHLIVHLKQLIERAIVVFDNSYMFGVPKNVKEWLNEARKSL